MIRVNCLMFFFICFFLLIFLVVSVVFPYDQNLLLFTLKGRFTDIYKSFYRYVSKSII